MALVFASMIACENLEPIDENRLTIDYIGSDPGSAEGVLLKGYKGLINQYAFSEAATDDAVNNQLDNGYKRIATGELSAQYMPGVSRWNKFETVFYLNHFLEIAEAGKVRWHLDSRMNQLFEDRLKGEALGLRGLYHFYVLQAHAGVGTSGNLTGVPYFTEFTKADGNFNVPRLSFEATVENIMADFDQAIELLPSVYTAIESEKDDKYADVPIDTFSVVNGPQYKLRLTSNIVQGLKARLALFAASPAYLNGQGYYETAAETAAKVLNKNGGIAGLDPDGIEYYTSDNSINTGEMLWRSQLGGDNDTYERRMYPPSAFGSGEVNPTHNLVMAFPMANGYPATEANGFDPQAPYTNRDPRLQKYIVTNGSSIGGSTINSGYGGGADRVDSIPEQSTTTGYYLRKLLRPDVTISNIGSTKKKHYNVYFRYTELFLILAEAANEIGGPDYAVEGISARDVIAAIRERAGITQPDGYLTSTTTKEAMRELIRNERRLELSFEGHRFWDLRRWDMDLNETATGYYNDGTQYEELPTVENRDYPDHATYMPIPYKEVLKFSALEQNNGW
ncbi:RagB/SusD family nutrient uptake outer membrane protein [Labilibacter marinus]|uniref:RagB/SusD family nutrient uptake outer membrane protein n=1 Tax=Labilibacter marinus TaxID=1477105 RepID=UPI000AC4701B|nr:RagB/SusD family nutrient uptake outer membrane protein [Labilibacter marinus]